LAVVGGILSLIQYLRYRSKMDAPAHRSAA
jgi:hypothetical protein